MQRATKEDYVLSYHPDAVELSAAGSGGMMAPKSYTSEQLLAEILTSLDDDKAEEVVSIDLAGKSTMADTMVICSGRSTRQVAAISEKLTDRLKQKFGVISKVEGKDQGDWVLIDTGDVIVHVFRPEVREFYQLEKMWMTPPVVADAKA
ncbi:MAG TPA: ribosome silencing factor [Maritimibacter sp.]|nr:ribosome silencing factor [Maritimibacter sp.]